ARDPNAPRRGDGAGPDSRRHRACAVSRPTGCGSGVRCPLGASPRLYCGRAPCVILPVYFRAEILRPHRRQHERATMSTSPGQSSAALSQLVAGIVGGTIRVVDLTVPLEPATPTIQLPPQFAPSKSFTLEEISHYDTRGPAWYWNNISCGEHTGTHFDAPVHWVSGKDYPNNATHNIPVERFIGPACVIDVAREAGRNADFLVTRETIEGWERQHGRIPPHAWVL